MLEQLRYLVEFQILEDKKALLIRTAEETPKRIADIEREFQQFEGDYLSRKAEHDHAKKLHRSIEQAIAEFETKIARSKTRMSEVKTNKEYQAMLKEIDDLKKEITNQEDQALEIMEKIESLGKSLKEIEKDTRAHKMKMEADREALQKESEKLKERLGVLEELQQRVRSKLEADLLKRCEFLLLKMGGIAVAAVQNGVCQVCHMNIPPQKYIELQRGEAIFQCPHCHRFIYWPEHEWYNVLKDDMESLEV